MTTPNPQKIDLADELAILAKMDNGSQFDAAAQSACEKLEAGDEPLLMHSKAALIEIYGRLYEGKDTQLFLRFVDASAKRCLLHIANLDLREALRAAADTICRRRLQTEDWKAVLWVHLALLDELLNKNPAGTEKCVNYFLAISRVFYDQEDYADLENLFKQAVDIAVKLHGEHSLEAADGYDFLALMQRAAGDYEAAVQSFRKEESILEKNKSVENELLIEALLIDCRLCICQTARQGGFVSRVDELLDRLQVQAEEGKAFSAQQYAELFALLGRRILQKNEQGETAQAKPSAKHKQ